MISRSLRRKALLYAGIAVLVIALASAVAHPGAHLKAVGSVHPAAAQATAAAESRPTVPPATGPTAGASTAASAYALAAESATWNAPSAHPETTYATPTLAAAVDDTVRLTPGQVADHTHISATVVNVLAHQSGAGTYTVLVTLSLTTTSLLGQDTGSAAMELDVVQEPAGTWLVSKVLLS
jgi:hypothetical protein